MFDSGKNNKQHDHHQQSAFCVEPASDIANSWQLVQAALLNSVL
jgi:hypothetical protein